MSHAVEYTSPRDLLHDATRLLRGGDVLPAAVMARAALDTYLRGLVAELGRNRQYNGLRPLVDALRSLGVIPAERAKLLKQLARIGNRAAHNYCTLAADVEEMIHEVRELVVEK